MADKDMMGFGGAGVTSLGDDELDATSGGQGIMSTHKECPYCHEWYVEALWPAHVAACELKYNIHRFT